MLRMIFKQLWNQRQMNVWIFIELVITAFFLWTVVDPVFVLTASYLQPRGYEEENRCIVELGAYTHTHGKQDTTLTNKQREDAFYRIVRIIREQPEVESFYIASDGSFPNSPNWNGSTFFPDSVVAASFSEAIMSKGMAAMEEMPEVHSQWYNFSPKEGGDIFRTLGIKDVHTGKDLKIPDDAVARKMCFISECLAKRLYGTTQVVGKKIYQSFRDEPMEIGGVFKEIKHRDCFPTYPLCILFRYNIPINDYTHLSNPIVIRLKDGVDFDTFDERFKKEVAPHLQQGNFYFKKLQSFSDVRYQYGLGNGVYNTVYLHLSLAFFVFLCIFLGMVGTFWIRCNARRQEIGLLFSMGASRRVVEKQFLLEAILLVTLAFGVAFVFLVHYAIEGNMTVPEVVGIAETAIPNSLLTPFIQFGLVSLLTYLFMLAIALIGTYIPVCRAAKMLPADALREE